MTAAMDVDPADLPTIQVKKEEPNPLLGNTFDGNDYDDDDEDEEPADELANDIDPDAGHVFFRITDEQRVKNSEVRKRTVRELFDMIEGGELNSKPEYQRDEVWTKSRQQGLIDSIFKGCPIPAIVLAKKKRDDGSEYFNVIDGKQRLTTVRRFMRGELAYKDKASTTNKEFRYKAVKLGEGIKPHFVVPAQERVIFDSREIVCMEHSDLPLAQEEDIFKRIQQGMTLVTGEKSSVGNSPRQMFIKQLVSEFIAEGKPICTLNIDSKRGRDFTNIASFVFCADYLPHQKMHPTAAQRNTWLINPKEEVSDAVQSRCRAALSDFEILAAEYPDPFVLMSQRVAPVEFTFIAIYLFITHGENIPMQTQAKEILTMREKTHKKFEGVVKSNATLYKYLWEYIELHASRSENGWERLPMLPDDGVVSRPKGKTPAKKQKLSASGGLRIQFDHRMQVDQSLIESGGGHGSGTPRGKRPHNGKNEVADLSDEDSLPDVSPKKRKVPSSSKTKVAKA